MRCWTCRKIILVPERDVPADGTKFSQTSVVDVECNCGAVYSITTTRSITRMGRIADTRTDEQKEHDRTWKNQE